MKKILIVTVMVSVFSLLFIKSVNAAIEEKYYDNVFNELKVELQGKGIPNEEMDAIKIPVKEMLKRGISKDKIKASLSELWFFLLRGNDLREVVEAMADMEKRAAYPDDVAKRITRSLDFIRAQGFMRSALVAKLRLEIQKMQMELR